jgi:hypothetical protein
MIQTVFQKIIPVFPADSPTIIDERRLRSNLLRAVRFMAKNSKSRRFAQQGKISEKKHSERFPYRSTLADAEKEKIDFMKESSLGGI